MASGFVNLGIDKLGYYIGQCTDYVATHLNWIPSGLGNANQWLARAAGKGLATSGTAAPGEVAVFTSQGFSAAGHVGVVESVDLAKGTMMIGDMNWQGPNVVTHHQLPISSAAGFLVPPGGAASAGTGPQAITNAAGLTSGVQMFFGALNTSPNDFFIRAGFIILGIVIVVIGLIVTFKQEGNVMRIAEIGAVAA